MSIFTKIRKSLSLKSLLPSEMRFPGQAAVFFDLIRPSDDDMARDVGDGTSSDVLMTPIRWLQRAITEAPMVSVDGNGEPIETSDLTALLNTPNPFYSLEVLLAGTTLSLSMDGNAYWIVTRAKSGRPLELWYAPHTNVEPVFPNDGSEFVVGYKYHVGATETKLELEDVIHFREGIDPSNLRKGLSPLKGLLREIWTDNEAAAFTAALLKNNGVPGLVISPADKDALLTPEEGQAAEAKIKTKFTRAGRGAPLVMLGPTKVEQFGFSPQQMDLSPLRDMSEERVTAALGVPAAVVGFGSGLQSTRVGATMREMRQLAWTNGVIPLQRIIAGEVTRALAPVFGAAAVEFDNRNVQALRENEDTKANRVGRLYRDGVLLRSEARTAMGFESLPADDVYAANLSSVFVPQGQVVDVSGNGDDPKGRKPGHEWGDSATADALMWRDYFDKQNHAPPAEQRIIAAAPSAPPVPGGEAMADRLNAIRERAPGIFQDGLERVFERLGGSAEEAARRALAGVELFADSGGETKQDELSPEDLALLEQILDNVDVTAAQRELQAALEAGYLDVTTQAVNGLNSTMNITFTLDDAVQQTVLRNAGLRAGLIDLDAQTRDALFDALAQGRAEGLASDNLARRIREHISAGPWRDVETRARVIARTEGAHAANVSTIEAARAMPETEHMQIFDDRMGHGDEQCATANGKIVTIDEAEAMGLCHPNGTRSYVPVNSLLLEEMGL